MKPVWLYFLALILQILLGLMLSWRLYPAAIISLNFFNKSERIFVRGLGLIAINYLIWGRTLWNLFSGILIFPWNTLPSVFAILLLVNLDSWISTSPQEPVWLKLQHNLWNYTLTTITIMYFFAEILLVHEEKTEPQQKDLTITQLLNAHKQLSAHNTELNQCLLESIKENEILRKKLTSVGQKKQDQPYPQQHLNTKLPLSKQDNNNE